MYGGYERTYKESEFIGSSSSSIAEISTSINPHNTTNYNESALLGLTKSYKLNSKWNGQIQMLYDFWWKDKGLNSPIILRFASSKFN